jgi:hypothetical protein
LSANFHKNKDSLKDLPPSSSNGVGSYRLRDALNYHAEGFNVIPIPNPGQQVTGVLNNNGEISSKNADGKSAKGYGPWGELQSQPQTLEDVERGFQDKEDCNIAILTGTVLGTVVFDIDGEEAQNHFDQMIEGLGDPQIADAIRNTMQTRTGGSFGRHIVLRVNPLEFVHNDDYIRTTTLWRGNGNHSEIKLKGEGGYIIAPPSLHASGKRYDFINKATPASLSREQISKILQAFGSSNDNSELAETEISLKNRAENTNKSLFRELEVSKVIDIAAVIKEHYRDGSRDELIFGVTGLLFKNTVSLPGSM